MPSNSQNKGGLSILQLYLVSAEPIDLEVVQELCQRPGFNIDYINLNGDTAFTIACSLYPPSQELLEILIGCGANINAYDPRLTSSSLSQYLNANKIFDSIIVRMLLHLRFDYKNNLTQAERDQITTEIETKESEELIQLGI